MGKIVVASNIGDMGEFIEHGQTGYLAHHKAPDDFADKINMALRAGRLTNPKSRLRISQLCDKSKIYNSIDAIYRKLQRVKQQDNAVRCQRL
jgi:glycosyltransferase involved in cell wall biosynthesis